MKKLLILVFFALSTGAVAQTSSSYIEKYKDAAIKAMNAHGVPASIILGVAMHESGNGTSKIARYLNNHFGIKGKNESKELNSAYKGYESVEDSYADFIGLLQRRSQYSWLFEHVGSYDYRSWILAMQRGGYAQSNTWSSKVIATIKKFKLYQYDNTPGNAEMDTNPPAIKEAKAFEKPYTIYTVRKGDTLSEIAKKYKTNVKTVQNLNGLKGSMLRPGQKLKL